jgi:hypothetical protein
MRRILLLLPLLLAACQQPSREAVTLAGELRRVPPGAQSEAMADRGFDCEVQDRACATLWLYRGAACAQLAESAPEAQRPARRQCAVTALRRAGELTPADAPAQERAEPALRLADALERSRDRALGEARRADNAAILAAIAPLPGIPGGTGYAAHYRAGVGINRVVAGDLPPPERCAALAAAGTDLAAAAAAPGLPPLADRIAQRRASLEAARDAQTPRCR